MTENPEIFARWQAEIAFAQKDKAYVEWLERSDKIVKRYRDERTAATRTSRRLNILWSNVETLKPAVFAKGPKPIVERRFMDRDPAARLASTILERCLSVQIEQGDLFAAVSHSVLDHLLPGLGQVQVRYEPKFEPAEEEADNAKVEAKDRTASDIEAEGDGAPIEKIASERVCVDYKFWRDFLWGPARVWGEVPWVDFIAYMTHSEIAERFYDGDMAKARKIALDFTPDRKTNKADDETATFFKKAIIHQIWNKADQTVYFIAPGSPQDGVLQVEKKPVLQLEGFWPCPPPLFATQTNETLVPVPDYVEYQDQAQELDDLTGRIAALTTALRVNGVYDASVPALARLLQEGMDNKLIPVDQWAAFAEKGGIPGAISLVPIKEIGETLIGLYSARQQVKGDLYEVTGMSDIIRGQGEKDETATAQRIKGQFASMRLEDRRAKVNDFVRSIIRIMAEIISEMFSEETLLQMSGVDLMIQDDVRKAVEAVPKPEAPGMGHNGGPPMDGPTPPMPPMEGQPVGMGMPPVDPMAMYQQAQAQAAQAAQEKGMAEFQKAVKILKSDKLRGFRVDIETDSTIVSDAAADKQAAAELLKGTTEALVALGPVVAQAPELMSPMGDLLMFTFRRFRVGRTVEAALEDALDQINQKIEDNKGKPPPPSPEQVKMQGEMEKMKMQGQQDQAKFQLEMQGKQADMQMKAQSDQMDMQMAQQKQAMEMEKMQAELAIEKERLLMEREKLEMEKERMLIDAQVKSQQTAMDLDASQAQHDMDREAADHGHKLNMETAEAKAKMAQKPKGDGK